MEVTGKISNNKIGLGGMLRQVILCKQMKQIAKTGPNLLLIPQMELPGVHQHENM